MNTYKVIDIFAGPGGLGEGFASLSDPKNNRYFKFCLSIEMDKYAHQTLELRSFFRQFPIGKVPDDYYHHLRGEITRDQLFKTHIQSEKAAKEAWRKELGDGNDKEVDSRIRKVINKEDTWVLLGGPPCQAYSVVGRSRTGGIRLTDKRVYLYKEYLRILDVHKPHAFIMENVKGLLSANLKSHSIFKQIKMDLEACGYSIYPITETNNNTNLSRENKFSPSDFIIRMENHGIPQARHRVIMLGIRNDLGLKKEDINLLKERDAVPVQSVLKDLPRLRSGLSKSSDSVNEWVDLIKKSRNINWFKNINILQQNLINSISTNGSLPGSRGNNYLVKCEGIGLDIHEKNWYTDIKMGGVSNHETRGHIDSDIHRYLFMSTYAQLNDKSPTINDFPNGLLPEHKNLKSGHFKDRFKVQLASRPSSTITCHISKDGHYYIHSDPSQCRSFTVREAARIQTFPDNYFFCGPRTEQYRQVGNAVPPLLANQIAQTVLNLLQKV